MADAILKIVIEALNKASKPMSDLKKDLAGVEKSGGNATLAMGKLKGMLGAAGVAGAVMAVGNEIKKTVTDWSKYAESIEKASRLAGVSSEDMSRLVQASDDFRVTQEALERAMVMALKNGFEPSIENLADLSDKYLALESPADRAAMASKIFGRQYAEMEPLLSRGGDAIRSATGDIASNLIVTDEAIAQNKDYIKQLDNFQDTLTGLKNNIGQKVLPVVTDLLKALNGDPQGIAGSEDTSRSLFQKLIDTKEAAALAKDEYKEAALYGHDVGVAFGEIAEVAPDTAEVTQDVADATNNAASAMKDYNEALLFTIASENLSEDAALRLAYKMGLVDSATVLATGKVNGWKSDLDNGKISVETYTALVAGLADKINALESKDITVTVSTYENYYKNNVQSTGVGGNVGNQAYQSRPTGGTVSRGGNYRWMEYGYGGERFVPSQDGYVLSRADAERILAQAAQGGKSGGDTFNLVINEAGRRGNVVQDFQLLKSLAR